VFAGGLLLVPGARNLEGPRSGSDAGQWLTAGWAPKTPHLRQVTAGGTAISRACRAPSRRPDQLSHLLRTFLAQRRSLDWVAASSVTVVPPTARDLHQRGTRQAGRRPSQPCSPAGRERTRKQPRYGCRSDRSASSGQPRPITRTTAAKTSSIQLLPLVMRDGDQRELNQIGAQKLDLLCMANEPEVRRLPRVETSRLQRRITDHFMGQNGFPRFWPAPGLPRQGFELRGWMGRRLQRCIY